MILKRITDQLKRQDRRKIIENFFSLSFLQVANYILPLITLPYLVRVLGPAKFGLNAFAQSFMLYFIFITDFGFNLSATREISIHRENNKKVSEIFISVYVIKAVLFLISFAIFLFLITFVEQFIEEKLFFFLSFLTVIGWILFPQWFFQGVEKMKFIAIVNFISKLIFTVTVFIFIRKVDDYMVLPVLNFIGLLVSGIISLIIVFSTYRIIVKIPSFEVIKQQFISGLQIFISNVAMNLYTTSNSVILGFLTSNTIVGYYSAAERIFKAFQFLGIPLYQAIFPHFSKLISENREEAIRQFNKLFKYAMLITSILSMVIFFSSPIIIKILLGDEYASSILIFSILSLGLTISWGNYTLGIHGLINFGHEKTFSKIVLIFGISHIFVLVIAISLFGYLSVPIMWIFTELMIFLSVFYCLKKLKIIQLNFGY
ncbi:MAG: flippase [Ignavibacteria bacterium]|nr:flippase [Ignavibacteria bacterium]